jgi:tetratricopeptide (TPR) repeat protein
LRIAEMSFGSADQRVAVYLHRLADISRAASPGPEAISLLERATAIDEASHGPAHPRVIEDLRCLAAALTAAGRVRDAITPLERILAFDTASSGELAETLLPTLTALANILLRELHNPEKALPYLERIVVITEHIWGPNDLRLVVPLRRLGDALAACGRTGELLRALKRLVELHDFYGAESEEVVSDLRNYTTALNEQQQSRAAQPYLEWMQEIERRKDRMQ